MTRFHLFLTTLVLFSLTSQAAELLQTPNTLDLCLLFLQDLTNPNIPIESRSIEVNNTLAYSGHNLNDLGNYRKCNNKSSQAFSLVSLSVTGVSSMMGFCSPSYCSTGQLQQYSENVILFLTNVTGKDVSKLVQVGFIDPTKTGINKGFWLSFSIILFSALGALVIVGTISANTKRIPKSEKSRLNSHNGEALKEALLVNRESTNEVFSTCTANIHLSPAETITTPKRSKSLFIQIAECFDLKENLTDLMKNELEPGHDPNLNVVHGIRALCFGWVVYGHTFTFVTNAKNLLALKMFSKSLWFLILLAAFYAVDTFFFLSGFFTGFFLLSKLRKMPVGFKSFGQLIVHRFLRLWPAYFLAILFFWKLSVHLGDGVLWFTYVKTAQACDNGEVWKSWLFLDTVLSKRNECFSWGWYLSNDFLMFLIAPFICWIYFKNRQRSLHALWVLYIISTVVGYFYSSNSGVYMMLDVFLGGKGDSDDYMGNYYHNPVVRMTPYLLGLYLGFVFKEYKQGKRNFFNWIQESNLRSAFSAILGLFILLFTTFFPRGPQMGDHWENGYAMTWNISSRTLFVIGIFFIIAPGLVGNLKMLSAFLSNYCFTLISRVSYSGYLVHLIILTFIFANTDQFPGLSQGYETLVAFSAFVISCFGAAILHLLIEKPVINIEMRILNKKKKESQTVAKVKEERDFLELEKKI